MAQEETIFRFNGLAEGAGFAALARDAPGLEISPIQRVGAGAETEIEVTSMDAADGWSVYLRQVSGAARVLHDALTMVGAARALVAAERGDGLPATLAAASGRCGDLRVHRDCAEPRRKGRGAGHPGDAGAQELSADTAVPVRRGSGPFSDAAL